MVTIGGIRHAKLQSNHYHQQANTKLFTGQMSFLSPKCESTEGIMRLRVLIVETYLQELERR